MIYIHHCFKEKKQDADKLNNNYLTFYANNMSDSFELTFGIGCTRVYFGSAQQEMKLQ